MTARSAGGAASSFPASWLVPQWTAGAAVGALMTSREGGTSSGRYASMNVGSAVGDAPDRVAANCSLLAAACGATPVFLRQVHGTRVVRLGAADAREGAPTHEADACVSIDPGIACTIQAADCLPILFAAPAGRAVGAAHAGWRGLAGGVLEAAVSAVCAAAQCPPGELEVWLGACIGPRAFEVGADVLDAFAAGSASSGGAAFFRPLRPGKWLADLPGLARARLAAAGVQRVSGGRWCTVEDSSRFYSHRRDGVSGRMAAAVWIPLRA